MKTNMVIAISMLTTVGATAQTDIFPAHVGIGTTTAVPAAINIQRSNLDGGQTSGPYITLKNTSPTDPQASGYNIAWANFIAGNGSIIGQFCSNYGRGVDVPFTGGSGVYITTRTDHPIIFATGANTTEKVRITTDGKLGIGIMEPVGQLHLMSNDANGQLSRWENSQASGTYKFLQIGQLGPSGHSVANWANASLVEGAADGGLVLSAYAGDMKFTTGNGRSTRMFINKINGHVGIGTITPTAALDVSGSIKTTGFILPFGAAAGKVLTSDANGNASWQTASGLSSGWSLNGTAVGEIKSIGTVDNYALPFITNGTERMRISANGQVVIGGTGLPEAGADALFGVKGNMYARKVKVMVANWPDYVFGENYKLRPLSDLEQYIQQHHHLPEVPSATEVKEQQLDLGDNQATLLKKIEELTLYLIDQNKKVEVLTQTVQEQSKQLLQQNTEIRHLKERRKYSGWRR